MNTGVYLSCATVIAAALAGGCNREHSQAMNSQPPATASQPSDSTASADVTRSNTPPASTGGVARASDDATVTAQVKGALLRDTGATALDINVDTVDGKVTLKGTVETQPQADRAVDVARGISGARAIDNQLSVKAAS